MQQISKDDILGLSLYKGLDLDHITVVTHKKYAEKRGLINWDIRRTAVTSRSPKLKI